MNSPMVDAYEVLRRPKGGSGRALVIGGGIRGVGVARALADKGVEIVLVEAGPRIGDGYRQPFAALPNRRTWPAARI